MNVQPDATFEAVIDTGLTGLTGTVTVEANDNTGLTTIPATTTGITEIANGVYAAVGLVAPSDAGQYTLIWKNGSTVLGVEDLVVTYTAPADPTTGPPVTAYATVAELQVLLRLDSPTSIQLDAMQRALDEAAQEIDWDLGYTADAPAPDPPPPLVAGVNLDRAVEHWRQAQSPFGVIGVGAESEPVVTARNSWYRHHLKLSPLRVHQGIA